MRLSLLCIACLLTAPLALADENPNHKHEAPKITAVVDGAVIFGEVMPAAPDTVTLADVLAKPTDYLKGEQKISGRIGKVCQKAGCWMSLIEGEEQLRVVFGDHAFSIPLDSAGQAVVYGSLEQTTLSEAKAKHMAEDAGLDPASVTGEQVEYRIVAKSVSIRS